MRRRGTHAQPPKRAAFKRVAPVTATVMTALAASIVAPISSSTMFGRGAPPAASGTVAPRSTPSPTPSVVSSRGVAPAAPAPIVPDGIRCLVQLHGLGGSGGPTAIDHGIVRLSPSGGLSTSNGLGWEYRSETALQSEAQRLQALIDANGCGQVVLAGFSNGGAMAVRLLCRGVTFGGRLRGVVLDDPVLDSASVGCDAQPSVVGRIMMVSDWMAQKGAAGGSCEPGWICLGERRSAAQVGTSVAATPLGKPEGHVPATDYLARVEALWR